MMGKGDTPRRRLISNEEWDLRWALFRGEITREEFDKAMKRLKENKNAKK